MFQIDSSGTAVSLPAPKVVGTPGWFTDGNPATAEPATVLDNDWFNAVQGELLAFLTAASIAPIKGTNNQVLAAIQALFASQSQTFGIGQSRQLVTGSRVLGTTYTNSTGKPITLHVSAAGTAAGSAVGFFTDGVEGAVSVATAAAGAVGISAVVAPGSTYAVVPSGGATLVAWVEYR